jgi:His/Glu/Gln/Arg/opine family amino acid ABC transporter permease subunit
VLLLLSGVPLLLNLAFFSITAGAVLAVVLALMRLSGHPLLDSAARSYVFVFRGTPLLVQIFLIYYGLGQFPEIRQSFLWPFLREPYWCALLALTLNTAAYSSEIIRGGILSVPFGQIEGRARVRHVARAHLPPDHRSAGPHRRAARLRQRDNPDDALDGAGVGDHADGSDRHRVEAHQRDLSRRRSVHLRRRDLPVILNFAISRGSRSSSGGCRRDRRRSPTPRAFRSRTMTSAPENAIALSVRNLRKRFGALEVLRGVSLDAHEGDVISILGASGSGKSTLLRCINLLEIPDDGDVVVAGETIALRAGAAASASRSTAHRSTGSARKSRWCSRASISGPT